MHRESGTRARVIAVTSGKGGVGKTNIAVSLSIALANLGERVILMDMDMGLANIDVILNLRVTDNLADVLAGRKRIDEIMIETPYGIGVVPGASGDEHLANLSEDEQLQLRDALYFLSGAADYLIIDTGAGISRNTTMFTGSADEVLVVATPEPTSMVDAYAAIKTVHGMAPEADIHLLLNMARSKQDAERATRRISHIALNFIHSRLQNDGYILFDGVVSDAVRKKTPIHHGISEQRGGTRRTPHRQDLEQPPATACCGEV
ncbi:hypothetical protein BOW53_13920 [Solemya pervernicosa gill symbiont]|uniref:AAA domain-containing protein n=1 Tax=Solemya pervernicosa gill symbiont TaxID=642797 RepID=A0A1T2L172_9GAMM|nr:MinD/ParA family protein [Solemya pervernicosa gill symbiont]OOZ38849.1 hypothetical protein BOW53_13920 [Solemya pervernicosa gill symbiont]